MNPEDEAKVARRAAHAAYMREYTKRFPRYRLFNTWRLMVRRCEDPRHKNFDRYGARGIKLCDAWHDFDVFWQWAQSSGYQPGLQIDRVDNQQGYSPENCRWTTSRNNNRNRCNNKLDLSKVEEIRALVAQGLPDSQIAPRFGVHPSLIYRIRKKRTWL